MRHSFFLSLWNNNDIFLLYCFITLWWIKFQISRAVLFNLVDHMATEHLKRGQSEWKCYNCESHTGCQRLTLMKYLNISNISFLWQPEAGWRQILSLSLRSHGNRESHLFLFFLFLLLVMTLANVDPRLPKDSANVFYPQIPGHWQRVWNIFTDE